MNTIKATLTIAFVHAISALMRAFHRHATQLPGKWANRICPGLLGMITLPETIICVTGTNGKTTVSNLIGDSLRYLGVEAADNGYGSNTIHGVTTTLVDNSRCSGKPRRNTAVLEVDERSSYLIYKYVKPTYLIVTNLFRDSYVRNANADFIFHILDEAIPENTHLILNADDLMSSRLKPRNTRCYFSLARQSGEQEGLKNAVKDVSACPICGHALQADFRRYNHIGHFYCTHCDYKNPAPDYTALRADHEAGRLTVRENKASGETSFDCRLLGHNVTDCYNSIAVIALLREMGRTPQEIAACFEQLKIVDSRYHSELVEGKRLTIVYAKSVNPISSSRVFDYVRQAPGTKAVLLFNTDYFTNGLYSENTAWLYDIDAEYLNDPSIVQIMPAGPRAYDYKVRLLLAGVEKARIRTFDEYAVPPECIDWERADQVFVLYDTTNTQQTSAFMEACRAYLESGQYAGTAHADGHDAALSSDPREAAESKRGEGADGH